MIVYVIMITLVVVFGGMAVQIPSAIKNTEKTNPKLLKREKTDSVFVWLVFLCLAFVATFRYGVGTDFFSYYKSENWINRFQEGDYNDPGFTLFSILCSLLFGNINGAITIGAALLTVFLFVFTISKRTDNFLLSILLFILTGVFTGMFNGVRQYLATAILFAGYHFIIEKKPIKWFLVVLVAATFHITALLMVFVYFVCNLNCNWKLVGMYFAVAVILLFAYEPLFNLIGALKQDEIDTNDEYMTNSVNLFRVAVQCVPLLLLLFVNTNKINEDKEARFLFNICLLNAALAVAAMNSAYLSRFWIYTSCFQVLMYPKIVSKMKAEDRKLFVALLLFFYTLFWAHQILNTDSLKNFYWIFDYL